MQLRFRVGSSSSSRATLFCIGFRVGGWRTLCSACTCRGSLADSLLTCAGPVRRTVCTTRPVRMTKGRGGRRLSEARSAKEGDEATCCAEPCAIEEDEHPAVVSRTGARLKQCRLAKEEKRCGCVQRRYLQVYSGSFLQFSCLSQQEFEHVLARN